MKKIKEEITNVFYNEGWPQLVSLTTLRSPEAKTKILLHLEICKCLLLLVH